ncbi:MAG: outer membrane lipoprotein carrier protein LolA [Acidobacteria bacterium]|nr:outer membrane lipoprotein carrier protein LolA [Acidobacteriota bacterium]
MIQLNDFRFRRVTQYVVRFTISAVFCFMLSTPLLLAQQASIGEVSQAIELHYNRLATLSIDFSQTISFGGASRPAERGTVLLYRPHRMRWDYTEPRGKLLVGDGERLYQYNPYTNQVRTILLDQSVDLRAPLSFLLGRLDFSRQFKNLRFETIDGKRALVGEGRTGQEAYTTVEFYFEPAQDYRLSALRAHGQDESVTDFVFSSERTNPRLDEKLFSFEAPAGAEILPETALSDNL